MKFLFLDIENANKFSSESKICLISQKVINEEYEEIKKEEILINPMVDFDEYILKNLPHDKNEFDEAKTFNDLYAQLKEGFEHEDQVIISRNGYNDIKALKNECENRGLVPFTFIFYDFNEIYVAYKNSLGENEQEKLPKTDFTRDTLKNVDIMADSLKAIATDMGKSLRELLLLAVNSEGYFRDGFISFRKTKDVINPENTFNSNLNKNSNYKVFLRLLENLTKPEGELALDGKNVCISSNYETENFKEMANIVMWLNENGAKYETDAKKCNIFVKYDIKNPNGKLRKCSRLNMVNELKENGELIEIVELDELLKMLGKTQEDLVNAKLPDLSFIYAENSKESKPFKKYTKIRKNFGKI